MAMDEVVKVQVPQDDILLEMTRKLPELRKAFNISQTQLGELVGKSRQQISKIERGIAPLSWDTCLAIIMITCQKDRELFNSIIASDMITDINMLLEQRFNNDNDGD